MKYRYIKLINGYPCNQIEPQNNQVLNYKNVFGNDCIELILNDDEVLQERYAYENNTLRVATELDRYNYDGNNYQLKENYYFKKDNNGNVIDILQKPPTNFIHPYWVEENEIWIESATNEEIANYDIGQSMQLAIQNERNLQIEIKTAQISQQTVQNLSVKKDTVKYNKEEVRKFQQAGSDFLNEIITYEEYQEIKNYINDILNGIEHTRPSTMTKYDPAPTEPPVEIQTLPTGEGEVETSV